MDRFQAFEILFASEGNAERAANLLSYALVVQLAGWNALLLSKSKKNGIVAAFLRSGIAIESIEFHPGGVETTMNLGKAMTKKQIEAERLEQVSEFGMLAANTHGRFATKLSRDENTSAEEQ